MRNVYFSFHYQDVWKVNQIRNAGIIVGARSAGFADRSLWEEAKEKSRAALRYPLHGPTFWRTGGCCSRVAA